MVGNNVSHSNVKTKRRFYPNLQRKRFYIAEEDKAMERAKEAGILIEKA